MSIVSRIKNLFTGFLSIFVSNAEREHPEIAYNNSIDSMVIKYTKLKQATSSLIVRKTELEERFKKDSLGLVQVCKDLEAALDSGADDLALLLLEKQQALEFDIAEGAKEIEEATKEVKAAKDSIEIVKREIENLKSEKLKMLAKLKASEAKLAIAQQIEGISVEGDAIALDNVRQAIKEKLAETKLMDELNEGDAEQRLKKLRAETGPAIARAKLEELKKKRAAEKAEQQNVAKELEQLVKNTVEHEQAAPRRK